MSSSPDPTPSEQQPPPRRLRRSADRRVAGVAGGLAEQFGLDATLVRVAFVILAFFGGAGLAGYVVGAFIIPDAEGAPPLSTRAQVVLAAIGVAALVSAPVSILLIVPVAIGVLVWRAFGGRVPGGLLRASAIVVGVTGAVVIGLAAGVAAAFGAGTAVAIAALVAGAGLVVAGFRGGGRWLIVPALLLVLPVSVVSAADLDLEGGVGDREYRPSNVSELRSTYELGAGELVLDLRDLTFEPGQRAAVAVRLGVGDLHVRVGEGVCPLVDAHAGLGDVRLFGRRDDGIDVDSASGGSAAPGDGTLALDLRAGFGEVVVTSDSGASGCR